MYEDNRETDEKALYNEESLKVMRINNEFRIIALAWQMPLEIMETFGLYGYQVIFNSLTNLGNESETLLKEKDVEQFHLCRNLLQETIDKYPPHKFKDTARYGKKQELKVDQKIWEGVRALLRTYETLIRKQLKKAGLSSVTKDEDWDM